MNHPSTLPPPQPHAPVPYPPMHAPQAVMTQPGVSGHPPMQQAPGGYPQQPGGHPGFVPMQGYPYPPPGYPQPINIVVQNTKTMTQNQGGGQLVRIANRNKWIAALLAFMFGWMGAHKFYLGQTGMGIVYLLTCWTAIPLFISLVETFMLVVASEREFDVRFNSRLAR